jgi:hypothetical protein
MASYNGITFYVLANSQDNTLARPILMPEDFGVVRNKLPYANMEHIQFTGRGNSRFTLRCEIYSDTDFTTLLGMVNSGATHTLNNPFGDGVNYANMLLIDMKNVWRVSFAQETHFDLTFELVQGL